MEDDMTKSADDTLAAIRASFNREPLDIRIKMYRALAWAWGWPHEYFWIDGKKYTTALLPALSPK